MTSFGILSKAAVFATALTAGLAMASAPVMAVPTYDATTLEAFKPGTGAGAPGRTDTTFTPGGNWLSLGLGGTAIFSFGALFTTPGAVVEITNGSRAGYPESADVYAYFGPAIDFTTFNFDDVLNWLPKTSITNASLSNAFTLAGGPFLYLAIRDTSPGGSGRDGFDIDTIGVTVVPLPAGVALLGSGLAALGFLGMRRKAKSGSAGAVVA